MKEYDRYLIAGDESVDLQGLKKAWHEFIDNRNEFTVAEVKYAGEHFGHLFLDRFDINVLDV